MTVALHAAEGVAARIALPVIFPSAHVNRVGMAENHEVRSVPVTGAPDVFATVQEFASARLKAQSGQLRFQVPCKGSLIAGHALDGQGLFQQCQIGDGVLCQFQASREIVAETHDAPALKSSIAGGGIRISAPFCPSANMETCRCDRAIDTPPASAA